LEAGKARVWYGSRVESVSQRIRDVIAELQEIQLILDTERPTDEALADTAAVVELKNYLDNLRHFVWAYLEAQSQEGLGDIESTLQNYRMKRVTEMLRVLRTQIEDIDPGSSPEAPSFFEELVLAADTVYDKNLDQYKKRDS
jgi:hypothetical protein